MLGDFRGVLATQCAKLEENVLAEHEKAVHRLELQVSSLRTENGRLRMLMNKADAAGSAVGDDLDDSDERDCQPSRRPNVNFVNVVSDGCDLDEASIVVQTAQPEMPKISGHDKTLKVDFLAVSRKPIVTGGTTALVLSGGETVFGEANGNRTFRRNDENHKEELLRPSILHDEKHKDKDLRASFLHDENPRYSEGDVVSFKDIGSGDDIHSPIRMSTAPSVLSDSSPSRRDSTKSVAFRGEHSVSIVSSCCMNSKCSMKSQQGPYSVAQCWINDKVERRWASARRRTSKLLRVWSVARIQHNGARRLSVAGVFRNYEVIWSALMIAPFSLQHLWWEMVSIVLVLYDIIVIPLEAFQPPETDFMTTMVWITRLWWMIDIPISCLTGYLDQHETLVMEPKKAFRHYAVRQMHLDILVVITDWAEVAIGSHTRMLKGWRMLRFVRVLRLKKARDISEKISTYLNSDLTPVISRIIKMVLFLLVLTHLIACFWYFLGTICDSHGVVVNWLTEYNIHGLPLAERYMISFHFAVALFVGEHTMLPMSIWEQAFVSAVLCFTFAAQTWLVSNITTAMTRLEIIRNRRSTQFSVLSRFLLDNNITGELVYKLKRNAWQALQAHERNIPEGQIELLQMISVPLKIELHYEMHSPVLKVHPFFCCYNDMNPVGLAKLCHKAVTVGVSLRDDVIFHDLEVQPNPRMLFISSGTLEYLREDRRPETVTTRNWVSEAVLWTTEWASCGTLRTITESRLVGLVAEEFQKLVKLDASILLVASLYAAKYVNKLNEGTLQDQTDIGSYNIFMEDLMVETFANDWYNVRGEFENNSKRSTLMNRITGRSSTASRLYPDDDQFSPVLM